MLAASPLTRQTVGRTFIVAISMLGAVALTQLGIVGWAFVNRSHQLLLAANERIGEPGATAGPYSKGGPADDSPNFGADPLKTTGTGTTGEIPKTAETTAPARGEPESPAAETTEPKTAVPTPPKPTPLPARSPTMPEPEQSARFKETLSTGRLLRDRGDMSTALTRFREASAMDAKSPEAIFEIAVTLEKMQLPDKAAEQWRRIYEMGEITGPFYTTAEARLNQAKQASMQQAAPGAAAAAAEPEEGIAPGKTLGLLAITTEDQEDRTSAKHFDLRVPIKARAREKVDVRDLTIQVLFYDIVDTHSLVQTTANVSSRWTTAPADWTDSSTEILEVDYQLPLPEAKAAKRENRKYFGYLVRIYYKGELQASAGEPEKLVQQFPPEQRLPDDANKK